MQWWIVGGIVALLVLAAQRAQAGVAGTSAGAFSIPGAHLLAVAIATADGTIDQAGNPNWATLGMSRNNPGDIEDSSGRIITYATAADGWAALDAIAAGMLTGTSQVYRQNFTLMQAAAVYTGNDNAAAWALTVATVLGVSINTTLGELGAQLS